MSMGIPLAGAAGMLCLALAAALLAGERERRLAAAGLLILGLALAAWRAGSPPGVEPAPPVRLGQGFLVVNAGLLLVGSGLVCVALLRSPRERLRAWARLLGALGIVLLGPVMIAFPRAGGPPRALASAIGLALVGAAVTVGARAIVSSGPARVVARLLAPAPLAPVFFPWPGARRTIPVIVACLIATLAGSHVVAIFSGVIVATWAAWLAFHPPGTRPLPVAPTLTLLLLPACWLLATIAGPVGLRVAVLPQVPLSPAAELLLTPALLLAGWATAGLWPLQAQLPGALLAPAGALLLARVAHPVVPGGLEYWRPLAVPLLVLGLWNAAAWGRWPLVLAGTSVLAVAAGTPVSITPWAALLAAGLALEFREAMKLSPRQAIVVRAAIWAPVTWSGVRVLEAVLRGEVVYTTLGVVVLALIVAGGRGSAEPSASPPR
jgi:hypothetical protein